MERRSVADSHRLAPLVAIEMIEFLLGNFRFAPDGVHNPQPALLGRGFLENGVDEFHVGVGLFRETHSEQYVDGKARVSNPRIAIVPVPANALAP